MKPTLRSPFAALLAILAFSGADMLACSSDSANPTPTVFDSGADSKTPKKGDSGGTPHVDSGTGPGSPDATMPTRDAAHDAIVQIEATLPDVGACMPDAMACNSCYTPAQNPLNGCSPATVNCIPFDNTRVPSGAP
jgi:hypothetical protein